MIDLTEADEVIVDLVNPGTKMERVGEEESESFLIGRAGGSSPAIPTQDPGPSTQDSPPSTQMDQLRAELEEARARGLQAYRRALLAENAGRVVPELVAGTSAEELDESIEVAKRAFEAARAATLAEVAATPVPAGNPVRQGPSVEGMSALEKIAYGLKTSN